MLNMSYFFFELMALLTVTIQYRKLKGTIYKYFLPFLLLTVIYEYGNIRDWFFIRHSNLYLVNITEIVYFLFYTLFLKQLINNKLYKKIIQILVLFTLLCSLLDMAFIQGFWKMDNIAILLQYAVIIFIVCLYFYQLMNTVDIDIPITKMPGFWLNTGLLFFYLTEFLIYASFAFMAYKGSYRYLLLFLVISNSANAILYSCLSVCFLCFNRTTKSS